MKKLLAAMALISLVACGSSGPYTQARSEGDYGYLQNRITENRYRVSFRGNAGTTSDQVKDMALLRAAELTLLNNYDWFRVVSQQTDEQQAGAVVGTAVPETPTTYRTCGALGCTTTVVPAESTVIVDGDGHNTYQTSIEIVMGDGRVDDPTTVYDASEIRRSLSSRY